MNFKRLKSKLIYKSQETGLTGIQEAILTSFLSGALFFVVLVIIYG
jgi:hypothetical protein